MRSKYNAVKTFVDGHRFDSKKEANRYQELNLLLKAGKIKNLELQVKFPLMVGGIRIGFYIADFVYQEPVPPAKNLAYRIVEDCKGFRTALYRWKKKHFEKQYGIKILET
jgi:hypothetical protein